MFRRHSYPRGFTLIELLVVIAIIGILASIVMMSLSDSRTKGRDAGKKTQALEILKALELHYGDAGLYPVDGTPSDNTTGDIITNISAGFIGGRYFTRLPDNPEVYYYCSNGNSMTLAVNTEQDRGATGSDFCRIERGPGPNYGCATWVTANAQDVCINSF